MNKRKLKAAIALRGMTMKALSEACGMKLCTFYKKVNGKNQFKQGEIAAIARVLNLSGRELMEIFFVKG